jgi:hypothetical protein
LIIAHYSLLFRVDNSRTFERICQEKFREFAGLLQIYLLQEAHADGTVGVHPEHALAACLGWLPFPMTAMRLMILLVFWLLQEGQLSGLFACDMGRRCSNGRLQLWH